MNKKGAAILVDLMVYFLFVIIVVIFWAIATHIQHDIDKDLSVPAQYDYSKTDLLLYLREITSYDYKQYTIADFIIESQYDRTKQLWLKEAINIDFDYKYDTFWHIKIQYPDDEDNTIDAGHNYGLQKVGTWSEGILKAMLNIGSTQPIILDKNITIKTTLPSIEGENIEITFENWVLFVI